MFVVYAARGHATELSRWVLESLEVTPLGVCSSIEEAEALCEECRGLAATACLEYERTRESLFQRLEKEIGPFPGTGLEPHYERYWAAFKAAQPKKPHGPSEIRWAKVENPIRVL